MKRTLQNHILDTFSPIGKPYQKEFLARNIYGSSRLGTLKDPLEVFSGVPLPSYGTVGNRNYELTNHLGNVLTVINDIKYPLADNGTITGYETGISHVFDYSPFGAPLDGRTIEQTLYQEVTTSTTTYTTEYALEEHFDSSPNWTPLTASSQVSYPSQVMRVKNTQTTKKTIGATESFTTGDGVHSLSFKSIVIPKDLCQAIIIKNSLATPQFNQNLYLQVIIRNQNGVVVATDSINVTGNYPDFLNFTATSGYTYSVEFVMRSVCRSNAVNNYFEVDDVLISYEEATTEEHTEFVASGSYLWGFNTQQRVDEIAGKGNHYTAEFWEYSPRLGKRWNLDPVVKHHLSGYSVLSNNPIIMIDPNGDTDYYNLRGKKVGSDGKDNGLIGVVHSNKISRQIKRAKFKLVETPANGDKFTGGFIIHKDIFSKTVEMAGLAKSDRELSTTLDKNLDGGYSSSPILEGDIVDLNKPNQSASVPVAKGEISIHTHPLGSGGIGGTSFDNEPSLFSNNNKYKNDEQMFKEHEMNIIIGNSQFAKQVDKYSPKMSQGSLQIKIFGNDIDKKIGVIDVKAAKKINKKIK
ncbi:MAG: hypothetical protein H3C31_12625 [Brumimicrobium sp.]|nr:hypothetical protein [Brumimicrobium sp.]